MSLKVLHIGKYFPPRYGGIESFMSQLMEQQAIDGMSVSALVHVDQPVSDGKSYHWRNCKIYEARSYGQLIFAPVSPGYVFALRDALKSEQPDILHLHMPNVSAFWLLFVKRLWAREAKMVIHWHSDVLGASPTKLVRLFYPVYRVFETVLLTRASKVIATSPPYLNTSQPLTKFKAKCASIPLGIKLEQNLSSTKCKKDNSNIRLCIIGRLTYYKGHSLLLKAVKALEDKNIRVSLDVIGDGELKDLLNQQCAALAINHLVTWHGSVSEEVKRQILENSDLLLLPSLERTEAFGVTLLEAASFSLPVLVSDVYGSGMTYVVDNLHNGLVCKVGDLDSLVEKLVFAYQNRAQLELMGSRHAEKLKKLFSINAVSEQTLKIYKTLDQQ